MKYRSPRSPPKNFKVTFLEEPPLNNLQKNYLVNLVPKIGRACSAPEEIQLELSTELCKYLQKSVGVSVVEKPANFNPQDYENHLKPITFRMTMNEHLYRIWIHED
jgi:hypothetical protein